MASIPVPFIGGGSGDSSECTATAADILEGKTAIYDGSDDEPAAGTMKDYSGTTQSATASLDSSNSRVQLAVPNTGKYDTAARLYTSYSNMASAIGLTEAKLGTGQSVLGITGTYKPTITELHAIAYMSDSATSGNSSADNSYTATASGTCYFGGLSGAYDAGTNGGDVTLEIYKNGTLQDSRNINSDNRYVYRTSMTGQSFSVSSGDVVRVVAKVDSYVTMAFSAIIAYIVTYT